MDFLFIALFINIFVLSVFGNHVLTVGVIDDVFKNTSPDDFKAKYGRTKPGFDDPIIVSCRSGRRSALAYELLEKQGYTK